MMPKPRKRKEQMGRGVDKYNKIVKTLIMRKSLLILTIMMNVVLTSFGQYNFTSSNLPLVFIDTKGHEIVDEPKIDANMGIIYNGENWRTNISDSYNNYDGYVGIEIRGNTSQSFPKKQYGFETRTSQGYSLDVSLMGFPKENDWILHAPYSDKTLMRNVITSYLSREMGHYAPRMKYCELFLNGEYNGVYILMEKIKRDKNRVDISKLNPDENSGDDLTGGYLLQIDRPEGDCFWRTDLGKVYVMLEYPKCEDVSDVQFEYIKDYIEQFERSIFLDNGLSSNPAYLDYIDINSFVDFFIINELSRNIDGFVLSTFFYKDKDSKDGKLKMGPVWDFNIAYGNADYRDGFKTDGFTYLVNNASWWMQLLKDSVFANSLHERWFELRNSILLKDNLFAVVDSIAEHLSESKERNFKRWPVIGEDVWPNYYVGDTYEDEVDYLKEWISGRIDWMDKNIPGEGSGKRPIEYRSISVSPNPFCEKLFLNIELIETSNIEARIYNSYGQIVYSNQKTRLEPGYSQIEFADLDPFMTTGGFYVIQVFCNDKMALNKKIVRIE